MHLLLNTNYQPFHYKEHYCNPLYQTKISKFRDHVNPNYKINEKHVKTDYDNCCEEVHNGNHYYLNIGLQVLGYNITECCTNIKSYQLQSFKQNPPEIKIVYYIITRSFKIN